MTKTPLELSFEDLDAAAKAASHRADRAARRGKAAVAGLVASEPAPVIRLRKAAPRPGNEAPDGGRRVRRA